MNNIDHLITMALLKGHIRQQVNSQFLKLMLEKQEAGKMGKCKDLSDFNKGWIVMARRLGQSSSKTAGLLGCSRYTVVSTYQKEGQPVNRWQGHRSPRLIDMCGEWRLARLVRSHRRATEAQIAE